MVCEKLDGFRKSPVNIGRNGDFFQKGGFQKNDVKSTIDYNLATTVCQNGGMKMKNDRDKDTDLTTDPACGTGAHRWACVLSRLGHGFTHVSLRTSTMHTASMGRILPGANHLVGGCQNIWAYLVESRPISAYLAFFWCVFLAG
ncbi:MAG: hypothetical protein JWR26_2664 [Pedosphaera sp.]|nr:hypothetical protein [Pedosphaera sp.]